MRMCGCSKKGGASACLDGRLGEGHTEVVRISQLKVVQSLKRQKRKEKNSKDRQRKE